LQCDYRIIEKLGGVGTGLGLLLSFDLSGRVVYDLVGSLPSDSSSADFSSAKLRSDPGLPEL
jgi:hypothetical protein